MKLTLFCVVMCLAYAITCLTSPVNGRPHPEQVLDQARSRRDSDSEERSSDDSDSEERSSDERSSDNSESEFRPCSANPGKNGGTCIDAGNDFNCTCQEKYFGKNCEEVEPCLSGWILNNGSCYYFSQANKTWEDARIACIDLSMNVGHLVEIHDQDEQDFLNSQVSYNYYWIGLNDRETEGEFIWTGTGRDVSFTFWFQYFVSNDTEDCVDFYYDNTDMIVSPFEGWNDYDCDYYNNYICEMKAVYN